MEAPESLIIPIDEDRIHMEDVDKLKDEDKNTFNNKSYEVVMLKAGMNLCRFVSQKAFNPFSNCWIDPETMSDLMKYFHFVERFDSSFKKEHIRNQLAILNDWNKLEYRVKVILKKDIVAYVGAIKSQKVFVDIDSNSSAFINKIDSPEKPKVEKAVEYRIGGFKQYFIPRLKSHTIKGNDNEYAKVVHFAHI